MYGNYKTEEFKKFYEVDYLRKSSLEVTVIDNGVVLPLKKSPPGGPLMGYGGVIDKNREYVMMSAQIGKGDTADRFIGAYEYDTTDECYSDETVIYIGAFPDHWGHFIVDMSYRFWYFIKNQNDYKIVYCSEEKEIYGVYLEFFNLLGIDKSRLVRVSKPTRYKNIIIPEPAYMACDYYTLDFRSVYEKLISEVEKEIFTAYDKIYMSRGHFKDANKKEVGESDVEKAFLDNGFKVLYMEELSLKEQIFYISHAKVVAALSGTLCHNIIFAKKDTELLILNKTNIINTHQVLINKMCDIDVKYIDVYHEPYKRFPVSYGGGPFWINANSLKAFFNDNNMTFTYVGVKKRLLYFLKYTSMCCQIELYRLYSKIYYKLCNYKWIIIPLRKVKNLLSSI